MTPTPSWTYIEIEDANHQPAASTLREAVPVLVSALLEVFQLWWIKFFSAKAPRRAA